MTHELPVSANIEAAGYRVPKRQLASLKEHWGEIHLALLSQFCVQAEFFITEFPIMAKLGKF